MPDPDRLATPQSLARLLQLPPDDLDDDAAGVALEIATAVVQAAAGQRIVEVVDDAVTVWGSVGSYLDLPERPVTAVTSVTLGETLLTQGTVSGTWRLSPGGVWCDTGWALCPSEPSPVTVVYTHGYPEGDQRLQLARSAVLSLARDVYDDTGPATRLQIDDYAEAYDKAAGKLDGSPVLRAALRRQYGRRAGLVKIG